MAEGGAAGAAEDTGCEEEAWSFGAVRAPWDAEALVAGVAPPDDAAATEGSADAGIGGETAGAAGAERGADGLEDASALWLGDDAGDGSW